MSSPADLPGRMSHTQDLNALQNRIQREATSCGTSSLFKDFLSVGSSKLRAVPRRYLRHAFIAFSIPVALIAGTVLPAADQTAVQVKPVAAAYAAQAGLSAFAGDAAVSEAALVDDFVFDAQQVALGAPVNKQYAPVTVSIANLRSGPGTNYERVGKLKQGQTVRLLGRNGDWYQVETNAGQSGWIHADLLDVAASVASSLTTVSVAPASKAAIGTTIDSNVNLRKGPGTGHAVIAKLPAGAKLEVLGQEGDWYRVATSKGTTGWVSSDFLKVGGAAPAAAPAAASNGTITATVGASRVNLRKGPNTAFGSFGQMAQGVKLEVLARAGDWYKVRSPRGTVGWVASDLISISAAAARAVPVTKDVPALPKVIKTAATTSAPSVAASNDAAAVALRFVGARYVYGGASPAGFDCSGLTSYVYRQVGVSLPHQARAQFSTRYGQKVSMQNLAPGDLVFFAGTAGPGISHVAIYVGNGMMVSANTPRTGVQYVSLYSKYWLNHYAGAIRPYR